MKHKKISTFLLMLAMSFGLVVATSSTNVYASEGGQVTTTGQITFVEGDKAKDEVLGDKGPHIGSGKGKTGFLPQTGEVAKHPMTWIGSLLVGLALVFVFRKNNKKEEVA